jgi:hypothetical protein
MATRIANRKRLRNFALDAGLCAYFGLSCLLIAGCAFGFYKLMQPVLYPNSGAVTYTSTALPAKVDIERSLQQFTTERAPGGVTAYASVIEPEGKSAGGVAQERGEAKKSQHDTPSTEAKRKRIVKKRDPMMDYAAQPAFGAWGSSQNGNGYRRSGNYQAPTGHQSWGSYQGWGGYRNGH